ncbi:Di-copper centre-containing protein [Coniochaeta ligniaria NRRL 30616]|uniref:Di-copper centre-containing protein n=1 Tax=Coniochaeta ligniaria NRRL 30616 TaxID=1408157 RepID=A0A1J7JKX2_9PEZI|nr:Di-copper centre-containing protein [Coniochaeta ligniaria NRRL 30616]
MLWTASIALLLPSVLVGVGAVAVEVPRSAWTSKIQVVRNPAYPLDVVDKLEEATMPNVDTYMQKKIAAAKNNKCTLENAAVRREWSDLTEAQRIEYTTAVKCLMKLPPKSDRTRFPGALSRFDDFVAYHMTHAMQLHDNIHLFGAHKYFVWLFEEALRNECNYTGYQPYMNYDRYAEDPINSPLLNGNASSLGGNGEKDATYKGVPQQGRKPNIIATGGGGGCVTSGPFSDMVVSLGPTSMSTASRQVPKNPRSDGTGSNPRCLRRDVNRNAAMGATADRAFSLLQNKDIDTFYNQLLGSPVPKNDPYPWGIHTAGHYVAAVDPGGDPNTSPGDPVFYFHHTSLDRLWWVWQMQDVDHRLNAIPFVNDTMTMPMNKYRRAMADTNPLDTMVDMEWLGPPIKLRETHDQLGGNDGKFCYVYV